MKILNTPLILGAALAIMGLSAAQADTITFNETQLRAGIVNADATSVSATSGGLGFTASTDPNGDGRVRTYPVGNPQGGLWFGATVGNNFGNAANNATAPEDAIYSLMFDQSVTSVSLSFDYLTDAGTRPVPEMISEFMTEFGTATVTAINLAKVSFDAVAQTVTADRNAGGGTAGTGTIIFDNGGQAFSMFSFRHQQTAANIGFTVNTITVDVSAVPLPAGGLLLVSGLFGLAHLRRRRGASAI